MHAVFNAFIPAYTHPTTGRAVPATDLAVFGAILAENHAESPTLRVLLPREVRAALFERFPHLADVDGIRIVRSSYLGSSHECDVVPSYCIPR